MQRLRSNLNAALIKEQENFKHARDLSVWQAGLNHAIDELIVKNNPRAPIENIQIGKIDPGISAALKKHLQIELAEAFVCINKHAIRHIRPERKGAYNQALRVDELRQIVRVLDEARDVSIDTENGKVVFWFNDEKDPTKINKILVSPNYALKKYGVTNYLVTVGKVDMINKNEACYIHIRRR